MHYQKLKEGKLSIGGKAFHTSLMVLELFPGLGQIISVLETCANKAFYKFHKDHTPAPFSPDEVLVIKPDSDATDSVAKTDNIGLQVLQPTVAHQEKVQPPKSSIIESKKSAVTPIPEDVQAIIDAQDLSPSWKAAHIIAHEIQQQGGTSYTIKDKQILIDGDPAKKLELGPIHAKYGDEVINQDLIEEISRAKVIFCGTCNPPHTGHILSLNNAYHEAIQLQPGNKHAPCFPSNIRCEIVLGKQTYLDGKIFEKQNEHPHRPGISSLDRKFLAQALITRLKEKHSLPFYIEIIQEEGNYPDHPYYVKAQSFEAPVMMALGHDLLQNMGGYQGYGWNKSQISLYISHRSDLPNARKKEEERTGVEILQKDNHLLGQIYTPEGTDAYSSSKLHIATRNFARSECTEENKQKFLQVVFGDPKVENEGMIGRGNFAYLEILLSEKKYLELMNIPKNDVKAKINHLRETFRTMYNPDVE